MLFGRKKSPDKTVLILDVENGSVGSALVRVSAAHPPKLFGEIRRILPVQDRRDSGELLRGIQQAAQEAMRHTGEVAARIRLHPKTSDIGQVGHVSVFFAAPWGTPDLKAGAPRFEQPLVNSLADDIESLFGVSSSLHTNASAVLHGQRQSLPSEEAYLLCIITGEMTEILLVENGTVGGYATLPLGRHLVSRTLRSHGGLSNHEIQSALKIGAPHLAEPLSHAGRHFAEEFADAARALLERTPVKEVYVLSHDPAGEWFAKSLAQHDAGGLFAEGSTVRALRAHHAVPHLSAHGAPDVSLMLQALFVDATEGRL